MTDTSAVAPRRLAVVTGASSGIGAATALALASDGWEIVIGARRETKLAEVATACEAAGATAHVHRLDVTDADSIAAFTAFVAELGPVELLVNNAGGAKGLDSVIDGDLNDWRWMFEANVMGTLQVTQQLYAALKAATAPQVINIVSIAGREVYPGGGGYNAAKYAETAMTGVMRKEFAGDGIRVCQIDPGRVATDFSLVRFKGDADKAATVYADKLNLTAEDLGETIRWIAARPRHMNIESLMLRPLDQV